MSSFQIITPVVDSTTVLPSESFDVEVSYTTEPANTPTTGVGVRLHFDSTRLQVESDDISDLFAFGLTTPIPSILPDDEDFDNDPNTDMFILTGWLDFAGNWPGVEVASLYTANFTATELEGPTTINFTASDTAIGFEFQSESLELAVGDVVSDIPTVATPIVDITVDEDLTIDPISLFDVFEDDGGDENLTFTITENTTADLVETSIDDAGILTLDLVADANGTTDITVEATDETGQSITDTFTVTVNPVNDAPTFTIPDDSLSVGINSGEQSIADFLTEISPGGGADEADQVLTLNLATDNDTLFSTLPTIDLATGVLSFTPATDAEGTATVTISISDDGGTENGGVDTSAEETFTISVADIIPPEITAPIEDITVEEGGVIDGISLFDVFEDDVDADADLTFTVSENTAPGLVDAVIDDATGVLSLALVAGATGIADITVQATDTDGAFITDTFTVTVEGDVVDVEDVLQFGTVEADIIELSETINRVFLFTGEEVDLVDSLVIGSDAVDRIDVGSGDDEVILGTNDRVFGGAGEDILDATDGGGGNRLYGNDGDDELFGNFDDRLFGNNGSDFLSTADGGGGNLLFGGDGNDTLVGGFGDELSGGTGDDSLFAGLGDGILAGGDGDDLFSIVNGELPTSVNTLEDFEVGIDTIGIGGIDLSFEGLTISDSVNIDGESGSLITITESSTDIAFVLGVAADLLTADNFDFSAPTV